MPATATWQSCQRLRPGTLPATGDGTEAKQFRCKPHPQLLDRVQPGARGRQTHPVPLSPRSLVILSLSPVIRSPYADILSRSDSVIRGRDSVIRSPYADILSRSEGSTGSPAHRLVACGLRVTVVAGHSRRRPVCHLHPPCHPEPQRRICWPQRQTPSLPTDSSPAGSE